MAIYHASIKAFSRGKGESSIAAAAYRAGLDLIDTKTKQLHRYSLRKGVAAHFMLAPAGAPAWCSDPSVFWDANEAWETRANARVGHELEVSLPHELDKDQRQALALELGQLLVDRYKAVVLVAIHTPSVSGDNRNHHVHLLMSARQVGPDGLGARAGAEFQARAGKGAEEIRRVRELVSQTINARLAAEGVEDRVDHRSLKAQSIAAAAEGKAEQARLLSRLPGQHMGRAITAALRRGDPMLTSVGRAIPSHAQSAMDDAVDQFAKAGRLMSTSQGHGPTAARADRAREARAATGSTGASSAYSGPARHERVSPPPSKAISKDGASPLALHLSRVSRLTRAQGNGAEVLNDQAKLIEEWLENMQETAREALRSLQALPGLQVEKAMKDAMDTALRPRTAVYRDKRFFYEDSEALVAAIVDYAAAIRDPHEKRERVGRAQSKIVSLGIEKVDNRDPRMASARRALASANHGVSKAARIAQDRRIKQARDAMTDARETIERDFYITPFHQVETNPPYRDAMGPSGGERKSDSNRQEHKPRARPRV